MLYFILGFMVGLILSILIITTLIYFSNIIETKINITKKHIELKGPKSKGFVVEPTSEIDEVRQNIINHNRALGKDTPISELK